MAKKILVQMRTESMAIESTLDGRMTQRAADDLTVFSRYFSAHLNDQVPQSGKGETWQ